MRSRRFTAFGIITFMILAAMFTVAMVGCGGGETSGAQKVYIGLTAPLSGPGGGYGEDIKIGLEMGIDEVNSAGGINIGGQDYIFVLKAADDGATPDQSLVNVQRFILEDGINIVYCPLAQSTQALMQINHKTDEQFLIESYTSIPLYEQTPNDLFVQGPAPFTNYVYLFIQQAKTEGWKTLGMLETAESYGEIWGSTFKQAWENAGGTVVAESPANYYTVTDFTAHITKVLAANPDAIFLGGPSQPTALIIQQARNMGYKGGFICLDQAKMDEIADVTGMAALENTVGVQVIEHAAAAYTRDMAAEYKAENGERMTWETAIMYTMFHLMVDSMQKAGSVSDIKAIRAAYAQNSVAADTAWPVEFDGIDNSTGQLHMLVQAAIVKNGEFVSGELLRWWENPH